MALIGGRASAEGTRRFRDRVCSKGIVPETHFRSTAAGLELSSIGLGTYLGNPDPSTDASVEEAVSLSLRSGRVNVIDTALNYRFQRAERSIGRSVRRMIEREDVARDEVFLASKNGYLAPDAESAVPLDRYVDVELVRKGHLRPADIVDGSHAMSVAFLTDQFERSRQNLGVETLDLLYLHNASDAQLPVVGRVEFLVRLRKAFELYESFRASDHLVAYGMATWDSLRSSRSGPSYLSVEEVVRLAREVGGSDHGFRFLQFPFNLAMPEAAVLKNQPVDGSRQTLFAAAVASKLGCFTSIPLLQGRLAEDGPTVDGLTRAQSALQFARSAPGTIAPLIGQKTAEHLSENLKVAELPPWEESRFRSLL
ncbi:MAG: aldo/keto reductase [Thermoplasmata archaeon]|nr:aldo/keto reductase [Thermoplasmata archaeon]MCI4358860.1 aldo/keto reductase [Thermoplasmata archaeon]